MTTEKKMTTLQIRSALDKFNYHYRESMFNDRLAYIADEDELFLGAINLDTHVITAYDSQLTPEIIEGIKEELKNEGFISFPDWLTENYEYSGDVDNGRDNAWLSKSPTDYNIYFESDLKKQYRSVFRLPQQKEVELDLDFLLDF